MASGMGTLHFPPATWRAEVTTEEDEPSTEGKNVPWDPPAPPLLAQREDAEECPGGGDKSLCGPLDQLKAISTSTTLWRRGLRCNVKLSPSFSHWPSATQLLYQFSSGI